MDNYLNNIGIENFRVFNEEQKFNFADITVLTGTNSSGKSSLITLLKFLKESFKGLKDDFSDFDYLFKNKPEDFLFNKFGTLSTIVNRNSNNNKIIISFDEQISYATCIKKYIFKLKGKPGQEYLMLEEMYVEIKEICCEDADVDEALNQLLENYLGKKASDLTRTRIIDISNSEWEGHNSARLYCRYDLLYLFERAKERASKRLEEYSLQDKILQLRSFRNKVNISNRENYRSEWNKLKKGLDISENELRMDGNRANIKGEREEYEQRVDEILLKFQRELDKFPLGYLFSGNGVLPKELKNILSEFYKTSELSELTELFCWDFYCLMSHKGIYKPYIEYNEIFEHISTTSNFKESSSTYQNIVSNVGKSRYDLTQLLDQISKYVVANDFSLQVGDFCEIAWDTIKPYQIITISRIDFLDHSRTDRDSVFKIKDLSAYRFLQQNKEQRSAILKEFVQSFGLAEDVEILIDKPTLTYSVNLLGSEVKTELRDEGFGILKLFPIIFSINPQKEFYYGYPEHGIESGFTPVPVTMVLEEPESNLHPALQSKLADFLVSMSEKYKVRFIIESHSEYFIRKLQYLTAKRETEPENTQLYYFHHPDRIPEGDKQIYPINIREDGSLTKNFGKGFFDEADNIALELLLLKYEQKN